MEMMVTKKNEVEFMRLAIEEAKKSTFEDDKVHPYVGAVVVSEGKVLASSCRGSLGPGEHAEYTVLEKKLANHQLAGCTVYTTLEPCTHRNQPKIACANRLVERKVSRVVIGMLDPDQAITGKGILVLRRAGIAVDLFPPNLMAELEELNRDFIRAQQTELLQTRGFLDSGLSAFYPSRDYYREREGGVAMDGYISTAKHTMVLIGVNLVTGIQFYEFCDCLRKKLTDPQAQFKVTISLLDPRITELMKIMAPILKMEPKSLALSIRQSFRELFAMKSQLDSEAQARCDLRVHKTIPFGSVIMLDHNEESGRIQVETKPYKAGIQNSFGFEIRHSGENDLYHTLVSSFKILLGDGESLKTEL